MSKSDDNIHKNKYKEFINSCHNIADEHAIYCKKNCYPSNCEFWQRHDTECINFRKLHFESFVKCSSIYCIHLNNSQGLIPSYTKELEKKKTITELTYEDDEEEY